VRGGLRDSAAVVMRLASDDAAVAALRFALLWSRARVDGEGERVNERVGARATECLPL